ncbi:MAG: hypothetical protein ACKOW8_07885, partial [Flavobacteriales bacterium]
MRYIFALLLISITSFVWSQNRPDRRKCHNARANGIARPENQFLDDRDINPSIARSDTFDIRSYDIQIDVTDYAGHTIKAVTKITFLPKLPGNSGITLDLMQLTTDSVWSSAGSHNFNHDGMLLYVNMGFDLQVDSLYELFVAYHG